MNAPWPRPIAETSTTITLRKRDWKVLIARLEDLKDVAAIRERLAHERQAGKDVARRDLMTGDELRRILDDESPVKVWRDKRGLSQRELAEQAGASRSYLAESETGKKPWSADALRNLSRVLAIPMANHVSRPAWHGQ